MDTLFLYLWCVLGVIMSFLLPLVDKANRDKTLLRTDYILTTVVSFGIAAILFAMMQDQLKTWNIALISGFTWQSTIDRLINKFYLVK